VFTLGPFVVNGDFETGDVTISAGTGFSQEVKNARGYGVSFGVDTSASVTTGERTENGVTTYSVSTDVKLTLSAGASAPVASAKVAQSEGIRTSYEVAVPAGQDIDPAQVDPFNPETMPVGSRVNMDGSSYSGTEFEASFRQLAIKSSIETSEGVSVAIERTGEDTVRVTSGPTEAIKAYDGFGVKLSSFSAMLGRTDTLSGATLNTAEFDMSTSEGLAAYNDFLATGAMPEDNGPGVDNVAEIAKLDYNSSSGVNIEAGPLSVSIDGASNTGASVVTTYPDGTAERTDTLQYGSNVPLTITRSFDADGAEIVDERSYAFTVDLDGTGYDQALNVALAGDLSAAENGAIGEDATVEITFSQSELLELRDMAEAVYADAEPFNGVNVDRGRHYLEAHERADRPDDMGLAFAISLIDVNNAFYGNPSAFSDTLFEISGAHAGDAFDSNYTAIPGSVEILS
jgi:hypothetical protein